MATKKGANAGEGRKEPQAKPASKASAEPRAAAKKKALSTAKASAAGRASPAKRPASPRIRASHAGVADAGSASGRARPAAGADSETGRPARPIPSDSPRTRARQAAQRDGDAAPATRPSRAADGGPKGLPTVAGRPATRKAPLAGPKRAAARRSAPPSAPQPSAPARELALTLAAAGLDKKAIGVEILEVVGRVDYADYLVIMTGRSDRHVHAIATGLEEATRKHKMAPLSMEGLAAATWVLIDYGDVVVHVFQEETRRIYDIEGLWIDAGRVPVPQDAAPPGAQPTPRADPS